MTDESPPRNDQSEGVIQEVEPSLRPLEVVHVPHQLAGSETGHIKLSFAPNLTYVQVQFKVDNENIKIDRDEDIGDDGIFEFRFPDDTREQVFNVWATSVEHERDESIYITCRDRDGKLLGKTRRQRIKFKESAKPPSHWFVDLIKYGWSLSKKRYVKYPVLLLIVLSVSAVLIFHPQTMLAEKLQPVWTRFQIRYLGKPPMRMTSPGIDPLNGTADHRPDPNFWEAPPAWWFDPSPPALITVGDDVGTISLPEFTALYDYKVLLKLYVSSDDQRSASWLVRVQENKKDYYLFRITFPTPTDNHALFEGFACEDGKKARPLNVTAPLALDYYPFHQGNVLWINIEIKGNTFSHHVYLTNVSLKPPRDPNLDYVGDQRVRNRIFTDPAARYVYGSFGFKGEALSQIKVVGMKIFDIE